MVAGFIAVSTADTSWPSKCGQMWVVKVTTGADVGAIEFFAKYLRSGLCNLSILTGFLCSRENKTDQIQNPDGV